MGTHHVGQDGCGLLAVVLISPCGVAGGRATKLVGFIHQITGKSLLVPPSGKAVVTNIAVSSVDKDDSSFGNSQ